MKLAPLVSRINALRKDIDGIKDSAGKIVKTCDSVYSSMSIVFDEIAKIAGSFSAISETPMALHSNLFTCSICQRAFPTERGLNTHLSACKKRCASDLGY